MTPKTSLPETLYFSKAHMIIKRVNIYNYMNDLDNFPMCLSDLQRDTALYGVDSDWYAGYIYTSTGEKKITTFICLNTSHPELVSDKKSIHISAIEIDPKFRDSLNNFNLHIFKNTLLVFLQAALKCGYECITLQAKNRELVPKYEHLGFSILDLSEKDVYKNNLDFYTEHPFMFQLL